MCEKLAVFFYTHFQKRRSTKMAKQKSLEGAVKSYAQIRLQALAE